MESRPLPDPIPDGHILVRHAWAGAIPFPTPLSLPRTGVCASGHLCIWERAARLYGAEQGVHIAQDPKVWAPRCTGVLGRKSWRPQIPAFPKMWRRDASLL